jgi:DNA-binding response OmpR family regulator
MDLYFRDLVQRPGAIDSAGLRPLLQALEILPALLDPRALKRAKELRPPQILALDDDADLLSTLVASLEMADLGIAGCSTAATALAALRGRSFDLILLDITMSDANGLDVCTEIRALPGYRQTPIVFLTSSDTTENRARSSLNGGTDFLVKPFNILELTLRAETWIYKYQFELM